MSKSVKLEVGIAMEKRMETLQKLGWEFYVRVNSIGAVRGRTNFYEESIAACIRDVEASMFRSDQEKKNDNTCKTCEKVKKALEHEN